MTRNARTVLALAVLLAALPALWPHGFEVRAQTSDPQVTSMRDSGAMAEVEERRLRFLFWAYAVIWILMAAYLFSLGVRVRAVRKELDRMRDRLSAGPGS